MKAQPFDHSTRPRQIDGLHTITEFPVRRRSVYEGAALHGLGNIGVAGAGSSTDIGGAYINDGREVVLEAVVILE